MGYCCGGIETIFVCFNCYGSLTTWVTAAAVLRLFLVFIFFFSLYDHMGYCCGGIETPTTLREIEKILSTTWVTAAAVLRHIQVHTAAKADGTTWVTAAAVLRPRSIIIIYLNERPHGLLLRRY